jgi:tetratricopeptide (TPR) repeat protein
VVEPSVFRAGDRVELEVRVVDGTTEEYLADPISRSGDFRNVITLYRELTGAIASEIQVTLTPQTEARLSTARTVNPETYEAYLKGQFHVGKLTPADLDMAQQYFETALRKDPEYALAYAGIAFAWAARSQMGLVPPREAAPHAASAAERAVELDSTLVEVQYALGAVNAWHVWDFAGAEQAVRRAIEINPNFPDAHAAYSHLLLTLRRPDEALAHIEKAVELDPFNPLIRSFYGMALHMLDRNDLAIEEFQHLLRIVPNHPLALVGLQYVYSELGRYEESLKAAAAYYAALEFTPVHEALKQGSTKGGFHAAMKQAADAWAALADEMFVPPVEVANLYALAGENAQALDWLKRGFEERDPNIPYIHILPAFRELHGEPGFVDLVRKMGLPE